MATDRTGLSLRGCSNWQPTANLLVILSPLSRFTIETAERKTSGNGFAITT
jgi:hypothetical protein